MVARYYQDLLRFCNLTIRNTSAAQDVVQETYARFLAAERSGAPAVQPRALLRQIARNLLIDRHRRHAHRDHDVIDELPESFHPAAPQHLQPDEALASQQIARAYIAAIDALPPRCREAFVLNVFDDLSHAQIAERMGISCSMVEKHIVRGMLACRLCERQLRIATRDGS